MARIEDYGLIGDLESAALVDRHGSIDWLCVPRFDSGAIFAALLGGPENGRWTIEPEGEFESPRRRYRGESVVIDVEFSAAVDDASAIGKLLVCVEHVLVTEIIDN